MICVPPDLEPLALLRAYCCENLEKGARILMCDCDKMCRLNDLEYADSIAQDAEDRGADGDWHGCVVVLLILAEACRKANELTRAHRYGERAFACCQGPADESKMTEAVAAYSLGIINYLQGERKEAGRRYEHGHRLFKEVEEDCLRANDREQAEYCDHAARLITKLWEHSSRQRFKAHGGRYPVLTGFCTSSDDAIGYCIAEMKTVGAPSGWQVSIEGELYRLIPLPGKDLNALTSDSAETYLFTSAPPTAHPHLGTHDGDYILMHYSEKLDSSDPDRYSLGFFLYLGKGTMEYIPYAPLAKPKDMDGDWEPRDFIKFERRPDDRIVPVPLEPPPARMIGSIGYGYPIAILRSDA